MFNQAGQTSGQVAGNVATALSNLRTAAHAANNVLSWVAAQTEPDLVAIGFDQADAAQLQSIANDLLTLLSAANGGSPAPEKDYFSAAIPLIGPVQ